MSPEKTKINPHAARDYALLLAGIAAAVVALQIAAMGPLRNSLWGSHLYAFVPVAGAIGAWAIVLIAGLLLLRGIGAAGDGQDADDSGGARFALILAVAAVVAGVLFWALRSQQTLLGDAVPLTIDLPRGQSFHPRQPLAMWLQQQLYQLVGGWFEGDAASERELGRAQEVARNSVAVGSVAAGVLFVLVAAGIGRVLCRGRRGTALPYLVALVLLTQGYAVLFFGYTENYTYQTLFVGLYLLTALLYLQRRLPLAVVAAVVVLAIGVHLSSVMLLPSFVFLVVAGMRDRSRRADAVTGLVAVAAFTFALGAVLNAMSDDFTLWGGLRKIFAIAGSAQGGGSGLAYMFSAAHLRDFVSEQILIGPLGALLFVPAVWLGLRDPRTRRAPQTVFLFLAGALYLAGSWASSEPLLGYARDWDLFAATGVSYTVAGLFLLTRQVGNDRALRRLLLFAVVLSLVQFVPWVGINHSEQRSVDRFAALPLGFGKTETTLGNHFFRKRQYDQAEAWFLRATQVDPSNPNANSLLGRLYGMQQRHELSAEYFRRAVVVRPDKVSIRKDYVLSLLNVPDCREALPNLLWLAQNVPLELGYWHRIGETLLQSPCAELLPEVYAPILAAVESQIRQTPGDDELVQHAGVFYSRLGRLEEALAHFQRALEMKPDSPEALFNTGWTLGRMGRTEEAEALLERFLRLYPDHEMAPQARQAIGRQG